MREEDHKKLSVNESNQPGEFEMKSLFLAIAAVLFTACYAPDGEGVIEEKFSTAEQAIVVCASQCAAPTYNGNPVACASNTYCFSDAAGAYCQNSWGGFDTYLCAGAGPVCGDGICNGSETWQTCGDCPPPGPVCGDGICNGSETWQTCGDCPPPGPVCGDGICEGWQGEGGWNCPSDCCPRDLPCGVEP
jgi:hypothetical protein